MKLQNVRNLRIISFHILCHCLKHPLSLLHWMVSNTIFMFSPFSSLSVLKKHNIFSTDSTLRSSQENGTWLSKQGKFLNTFLCFYKNCTVAYTLKKTFTQISIDLKDYATEADQVETYVPPGRSSTYPAKSDNGLYTNHYVY